MTRRRINRKEKARMIGRLARAGMASAALLSVLCAGAPILKAAEREAPAAIRAAIAAALRTRLADLKGATAEVGAIDPRLRLPACPALDVGLPQTGAPAMTARVACASPQWTIYVPIRLHAWIKAVVAATNLAPNTALTAGDLARGRVDMFASPGGLMTDRARAQGRVLQVGLMAGAPILKSFLKVPLVVHRGEKVLLSLTDGTMSIRDTAVALGDGRVGDSIAVRNPESGKIVQATVAGDGTVVVKF
jgi:flagella basal body P-ring formation protein FlgA